MTYTHSYKGEHTRNFKLGTTGKIEHACLTSLYITIYNPVRLPENVVISFSFTVHKIPLCTRTAFSSFIHLLMDIKAESIPWLLWTVQQLARLCCCLCDVLTWGPSGMGPKEVQLCRVEGLFPVFLRNHSFHDGCSSLHSHQQTVNKGPPPQTHTHILTSIWNQLVWFGFVWFMVAFLTGLRWNLTAVCIVFPW